MTSFNYFKIKITFAQAVSEVFLMLPLSFAVEGFNEEPTAETKKTSLPKLPSVVGLVRWKQPDSSSGCWALLFGLKEIEKPKQSPHIPSIMDSADFFGRVESGAEVLRKLSAVNRSQRNCYTFTIEAM